MKTLYKVLDTGRMSPYQKMVYELGKKYHCDDFDDDPLHDCSRGFYATDIEGLPYAWRTGQGKSIYEVQVWGEEVEFDQYKRRYENIELTRRCTKAEIFRAAKNLEGRLGCLLSEILWPINPLCITDRKIDYVSLLKQWASVRAIVGASVRASVGDSVRDSVWASVGASVGASVRASVGASVRASVWAYMSSLFPGVKKWQYFDHKPGENPFQPGIDLWRAGYVPSFDGKTWRLHAGPQAEVVYEIQALAERLRGEVE